MVNISIMNYTRVKKKDIFAVGKKAVVGSVRKKRQKRISSGVRTFDVLADPG
jgi:hypothetical protein